MNFFSGYNTVDGHCPHCQMWYHVNQLAFHMIQCENRQYGLRHIADRERIEPKRTSVSSLEEMWNRG